VGKRSRTTRPSSIDRYTPHDEGWGSTASSRGLSPHCTERSHQGKGSPSGHVRSGNTGRMNHCKASRIRCDCTTFGMEHFLPSCLPFQCSVCTFVLSDSILLLALFRELHSSLFGCESRNPTRSSPVYSRGDTRLSSARKSDVAKIETLAPGFQLECNWNSSTISSSAFASIDST
jgi:hypothetical protein